MIIAERYEILGKIGTGGMADVYKAKDHKLNRFVAVKVLKQEFREDTTFIRKFRSEAQAAAGLTHPNIVNVFDVGDDDGVYYIVMELIEGITLKEYIAKKGKLSIKEATSIAIQVSMGLEAAHNHGIVHRDVKPQNIIISTDGKVKVTDFGIARAASSNTISSNVMGSVHYSSPEQVRGGYSDEKSDIYSLGITLYEMVTGRVPFDGDTTVAIAIKHLQEEMIPPSVYTPDLPYSLEQIIFKCTQKSVGRRYAKMEDVIADLKHSLIDPSGDFVKLSDVDNEAKTVIISDEELGEIKHTPKARTGQRKTDAAALEEEKIDTDYDDGDDDDEYERRRSLERRKKKNRQRRAVSRTVTIAAFLGGALILIAVIFFVVRSAGLLGGGTAPAEQEQQQTEDENDGLVEVPNLVGRTQEEAEQLLEEAGLTGHPVMEENDAEQGTVFEQHPEAGEEVDEGSTVTYKVSSGPDSDVVENVNGYSFDEAQRILGEQGFGVTPTYEYSSTVQEGYVISYSPAGAQPLGTTITLVVSKGPEPQPDTDPEPATDPEPDTDPDTDSGGSEEEWAPGL